MLKLKMLSLYKYKNLKNNNKQVYEIYIIKYYKIMEIHFRKKTLK